MYSYKGVKKTALLLFINIICIRTLLAQDSGNVSQTINLKTSVLNSSQYDKNIRPPVSVSAGTEEYKLPTSVTVSMYLVNVFGLDDVSGIFSTYASLAVQWTDGRVTWNASEYGGVTQMYFNETYVWKPTLTISNPTSNYKAFGNIYKQNVVVITSEGGATWLLADIIQSSCDVNANYYPFDKQECIIWLVALGYKDNELQFSNKNMLRLDYFTQNAIWNIYSSNITVQSIGNVSHLKFTFKLERKSTYFIVNAFVPVFILGLLNTMVFILPVDSGERAGYSITCLLAIAVLLTIINDNLPKASDPIPIISFFMMLDLGISGLITMITILNLRFHMADEKSKVPACVQRCFRFLCCKSKHRRCVKSKNDSNIIVVTPVIEKKQISEDLIKPKLFLSVEMAKMQNTSLSSRDNGTEQKQGKKQTRAPEPPKPEPEVKMEEDANEISWKDIAGYIDVLSFILGNSLTVILVLMFLSISNSANVK